MLTLGAFNLCRTSRAAVDALDILDVPTATAARAIGHIEVLEFSAAD